MNLIISLVNGILFQFHRFKPWLWIFDAILILTGALFIWKREKDRARTEKLLKLTFWAYLVILFSGTVFMRRPRKVMHCILNPIPFFRNVLTGNRFSQMQLLYNILMFIPYGILFPLTAAGNTALQKNQGNTAPQRLVSEKWRVFGTAFLCSVLIELIQLVTRRGYFEIADIIVNVAGAGIGWGMFLLAAKRKEK